MANVQDSTWNFYTGQQLSYGRGCIRNLQRILPRLESQHILIVSDPVLRDAGILQRVLQAVKPLGIPTHVFDQGVVEPDTDLVGSVADLATHFNVDTTIAVGGGSNMDLAKLACAVRKYDIRPAQCFGVDEVPGPIGNLICVPTTAGTGSEVSHAAVIKNSASGRKEAALSQYLRPSVAIVDPSLTDSCPGKVTAESGIDALTHAVEAYLTTTSTEFSEDNEHVLAYEGNHVLGDLYAEKAIGLIGNHLVTAVHDPKNSVARDAMALAATLAGLAFSNCGVSLAHALEYWIGAKYDCAHGAGNGIVLPEVMRFYLPVRQERLSKIRVLLNGKPATEPQEDALQAISLVENLRSATGLPRNLREVGAESKDLPGIAKSAFLLKRLMALSPREVSTADLLRILEACF